MTLALVRMCTALLALMRMCTALLAKLLQGCCFFRSICVEHCRPLDKWPHVVLTWLRDSATRKNQRIAGFIGPMGIASKDPRAIALTLHWGGLPVTAAGATRNTCCSKITYDHLQAPHLAQ